MGKTYEAVGTDVRDLIANVASQYHPHLTKAGVTISAVFAVVESEEEGMQYAIRHAGLIVAAQIAVTSLSDRTRGLADAKLTICQLSWSELNEQQRVALIDHELTHLECYSKGEGETTDDLGRPLIRIRPHDWELTGFAEVVERHGQQSLEAKHALWWRASFADQLELLGPGVLE